MNAWYESSRKDFILTPSTRIVERLARKSAEDRLDIEPEQSQEWQASINSLQSSLQEGIPILKESLKDPELKAIKDVVLEFDFKRRGLRIDCILLGEGILFIIEFKRSTIKAADRDQVMRYAVNLLEFHQATREWCHSNKAITVPIVSLTAKQAITGPVWPGLEACSWPMLACRPMECDQKSLQQALYEGIHHRLSTTRISRSSWISSPFSPSSSIVDATVSLYGGHNVSAISQHAAAAEEISRCRDEIELRIKLALNNQDKSIVFLSGSPGAGKTLVGLDLAMKGELAAESVFVTGNAPLVDVLNKALSKSYRSNLKSGAEWQLSGYHRSDANLLLSATDYKIVKAHRFLDWRGSAHRQTDGRVLIFDEAQRTYEKGRIVLGSRLQDHEADLILKAQSRQFTSGGTVLVALVGHDQYINRGERGISAWLEAAERQGWSFYISDQTLELSSQQDPQHWKNHKLRSILHNGHLSQSVRYYRNSEVSEWVNDVLNNKPSSARARANSLRSNGDTIFITRSLEKARTWGHQRVDKGERVGLIASGQARRLAAEGLFVDLKPDIATWMLAPSEDVRSSNALESVQNQYQVQGLELDYTIICWDADLRRTHGNWNSFKLVGSAWTVDSRIDIAKNGYRVLLTRARKGMIIFVPSGDLSRRDVTRRPKFYDEIASYLLECGAHQLEI
jgi:hypothetical protein